MIQRREALANHYKKYHPTVSAHQEWNFNQDTAERSSNPRQKTLSGPAEVGFEFYKFEF